MKDVLPINLFTVESGAVRCKSRGNKYSLVVLCKTKVDRFGNLW